VTGLALVCVGGGSGRRFGGDKLAIRLGSRTVFATALNALCSGHPEAPLVVVAPAAAVKRWQAELGAMFPKAVFVAGGALRQDSVRAGVERAADLGAEVVAVHDAARPVVHPDDVRGVVEGLGQADAAILCRRVDDTVKRVGDDDMVRATVPREDLRLSLTPQVFRVESLRWAWDQAEAGSVWTDEAALLEEFGMSVRTVEAVYPNPKLTTIQDLSLLQALVDGGAA
jgi:2-C-methyl-D-erythritol 4-phosphate cytidylyltransferase